jgi:hypothetical protein
VVARKTFSLIREVVMNLTENLKSKIKELYDSTDDNVHGVSLGHKFKGGAKTGEISIVFMVLKKLPKDQIPSEKMIPSEFEVDGIKIKTDVQESKIPMLVSCYAEGDPNITRLQPVQSGGSMLLPMRGGQEIIMFPKGWEKADTTGYNIEVGTLGFFCVDDLDGKTVGMTNSHVVVENYNFCSEKQLDGSNTYDPVKWVNGSSYNPSALSANANGPNEQIVKRIKRFSGVSLNHTNYVDSAVLMMQPSAIDANSYKMWGPIGVDPFSSPMSFATTQEIDSLLATDPRLFSTGRTSGPKGFTNSPSCNLRTLNVGAVGDIGHPSIGIMKYSDMIAYSYEDYSEGPSMGGDSGSALIALFGSTYKIIGQVFAGGDYMGLACRIDRIAQEMKVRAWDGTLNKGTGSENNLGELRLYGSDQRSGQTSFVHTDGHTYWQVGSRI